MKWFQEAIAGKDHFETVVLTTRNRVPLSNIDSDFSS
jgi:hypothetical protein